MTLEEGISKTYSSNTVQSDGEESKLLLEFTYSMETQLTNVICSEWVRALSVTECYALNFCNSIRKDKIHP